MQALRLLIILGALVAGLAEAQGWEREVWSAALVAVAIFATAEIAADLYRLRPSLFRKRIAHVLQSISQFVLHDSGTYTLTVYRRSRDGKYRPHFRYSRAGGFLRGKDLDPRPAFPYDHLGTTIGGALNEVNSLYTVEDMPLFGNREAMLHYHTNDRHLPMDLVTQFSDRAIRIRSVGSIAIPHPVNRHDVVGVLTIDCMDSDGFKRHSCKLHPLTDLLGYWVHRLGEVLPSLP